MKKGQNTRGYERYLAFDNHREYILAGGQNEDQEWVLMPRRLLSGSTIIPTKNPVETKSPNRVNIV